MSELLDRRLGVLGALRLESGERWGDVAHPFQLETVRQVLDPDAAAPYSFTVRARGGSKTGDLAGCGTAQLLTAPSRARLYWAAADLDQATLGLDAIAGYQARTPEIAGALEVQARRVVAVATGASLEFLPADESGSWGLLPHAVFIDELAAWTDARGPRRLLDSLLTAATKVPGARVCVLTSAGSPRHFAYKLLEHARTDPLWATFERTGPPPWADEERLREQRRRLPEPLWRQLFEGHWVEAEGDFLAEQAVDAAFSLTGPSERPVERAGYVAALDLGHVHDRSVFGVAHRDGDGRVVLDHLRVWAGSRANPVSFDAVEEHIVLTHGRGYRFMLRADPWQALHLFERLRRRGIRVEPFTFSPASKTRLASTLLQVIGDGALALYPVDGLRDELIGLRLKQGSAGSWSFDSAVGGHDDMAVCLALLCVAALERGAQGGPMTILSPVRYRLDEFAPAGSAWAEGGVFHHGRSF